MLPATFQAIAAIFAALLPGALFVYAMERITGPWGIRAGDRVLRFTALSIVAHIAVAPVTWVLWRRFIEHGELARVEKFPWLLWWAVLAYATVPFALGTIAGVGVDRRRGWAQRLFGRQYRAPRAFDYCFAGKPTGYVRMLIDIGADEPIWVGGSFTTEPDGRTGYVAAYPEEPDIFLPVQLNCDPDDGEWVLDNATGKPERIENSLLVDQDKIVYLEFIVTSTAAP